jgi:hypothetical protein
MRIITAAVVMLALLATPASAQMGGGRRHNRDADKKTEKTPKYDEKAYKAALDSIPVAKHPYDPWGHMRPADNTKTPK